MTIEDMILTINMEGADRAVLVRDEKEPGVLVLMLDHHAHAELGVALQPIANELGEIPAVCPDGSIHTGIPRGEPLTLQSPVKRVFADCDASPRNWLFFTFPYGNLHILGMVFTGEICQRVAAVCNAHRAPCSLDRKKSPPGYQIDRTIQK